MATRKKTAARPILSLDDLDAAGIGLGWQPMVPAQEVVPVAPVEQEQDGPMARGVKQVSASVGLAGRLAARDFDGAAQNISEQAAYRAANPGSEEAQGLRRAWQQGDGIWGGIKAVAGEFADDYKRADGVGAGVMSVGRNLQAMGSSLVEQVPNMALPMAGMIGGGAAGSAAGPVGTVAGGWAGASAGNALVGTSEAAFRQLEKAGVNPTDAAAVREYLAKNGDAILGETAIKGGVIGAVDVATAGLAHWLLSGPGKLATTKALTEMGVDMADKAAVKAATQTPVFKKLIANDATYQATQVGAQKLLRNTGAAATEPVGEFAGEYGGSLAATGEADAKDAFLEAASSLGQSGIMFAGQKAIQAIKSPSQAAADQIRATEKVPESGALTRAVNTGVEAKAQAVEAGAPLVDEQAIAEPEPVDDPVRDQILALPDGARQDALRAYAVVNRTDVAKGVQQYNRKLLDRLLAENATPPALGERLTDTDMGTMLGGGGMAGQADPLVGALGMNNEAQANSITNVANVAERRPPMPASDAARMLDEARNRGLDLAVVEHPSGGFVLIPPTWVTPDMAAQGEARLNETIARMQQADAAPVERAPRTRTDGVGLDLQTDPVQNYVGNLRSVNTPAARAYVRDFDAGRITPADVQRRMVVEQGVTPDQRIARAAAEAPATADPVADRLRQAVSQRATPAPTDILNPAGEPFKTRMAADRAAKKTPGAVVPVEGGFVVRPQEPVNVQDVPQAPEVPQAAPAISPPSQAPQAVGAQPAGPAIGRTSTPSTAGTPEVRALTDGTPTANTGAQAAPAPGPQAATAAEPEFTTLKTVYGDSVTVRTADLNSDKPRLRQYTKAGKSKAVPAIHRDNLDLTGDKRKASAKEDADNPFFNVITTKDGSTFATKAAASRELNHRAMGETHEVVAASEVQDGAQGFVIRRKRADAIDDHTETGANQAEAPTQQAQSATENVANDTPQTQSAPVGDEQRFSPESGTLGIPRAEMPQVPTQSHGGLVKHLNAQGIEHETTMVDAAELKPTQAEFSPSKVEKAKEATGDRAVIVSSDGHIIDGHHQALAAAEEGKPVKAIVLDMPVEQALEAVKNSPSAASRADQASDEREGNYARAVEFVRSTGEVKRPAIQDALGVSFAEVNALLDRMEHEGVVTAAKPNGARSLESDGATAGNADGTYAPESSGMRSQEGADGESVPPVAPAAQPDTPKLTPAEAKSLMAWEDLGQKDGVKTHALTFYESQADKDAKRGRMIVAKVSKGDRSATAWMVDGEDKTFGALAQAKKLAEEVGMAKAVADGFVEATAAKPAATKPAAAPQPEAPAAPPINSISGRSVPLLVGQRLPAEVIAKEVENRIGQFAHQPRVLIRERAEGVLPGASDDDAVAGAVYDGAIYLFRDQLANRSEVRATLFHELLHYGLRRIFSRAQFIREMQSLYERDAWIKARADAWATSADGRRAALYGGEEYATARGVDEALARLAEPNAGEYTRTDLVSRAVAAVSTWLADVAQRLGFAGIAAQLRGMKNQEARALIQRVFSTLQTESDPTYAGWWDDAEPAYAKKTAGEPRNLVTLHNMTAENLAYADQLGGIPVPSIGITKVDSPFNGFGDITLIASNDMIDPKTGVPVYDRDAWTARFPTMNFKKVKAKLADAFYDRMEPVRELMAGDDGGFVSALWEQVRNASTQSPEKVIDIFTRYEAGRVLYAKEVLGKSIKVPTKAVAPREFFAHEKPWLDFVKSADWSRADLASDNPEYIALRKEAGAAARAAVHAYAARTNKGALGGDKYASESRSMIYAEMADKLLEGSGALHFGVMDRARIDAGNVSKKMVDRAKLFEVVQKAVKHDDPGYLRWVQSLVQPLFEAPTITLRGKEVPATLDNIVSAMTVGATAGVEKSMTFSPGKVAAMLGKRFKSLDEIKAARDRVVSQQAESESKNAADALLTEYRTHVGQFYTYKDWRGNIDTWAANDDSMEALAKAGKLPPSDANIRAALARMGFKGVDQQALDLARNAIEVLRNAATDYFEAKPQRAVSLNEFKGAVVPKGTSAETIAILEKHGIAVEVHNKTEGAREKAIQKLAKRLDKENGGVLFSRTPPADSSAAQADSNARNVATQLLIDGLKAKWTRAPEIIVARNMQDAQIPQEVRDYDALLKSQGATGEPRGFIYKGKVYLLSDQLKGPQQIAEVLFHEVLGHYGLRGAFGDGLTPILKQLGALRRKEVVAKAREYGLFNKDALGGLDKAAASDSQIWDAMSDKQRLDAAEEVLAEMAQTQPTIGFVQRAIAAIRNWLRANVPGFKNLKLKDADIVQAYILPARAYVTRSNETAQQAIDRAMTDAGFSRTDDRINFSRTTAQSIASSMGDMTPDQEKAYKNVAGVKAVPTVRERMDALKANLGLKLRQGLVDQFAAIKQLDQNAYVQARMSKGTDGTLEAMLMYGKPFMRDGAPDVDVKDGGFAKVLASLKGEQDRWMMWIAAQRAEKLKADGKENLMTDDDISALKTLNAGKMADGTARMPIYAKALAELNEYNDAMLKLAMESGLIDQAAYDLMAGQPYVPFYRLMEDGDMKGPKFSSGLTNQKAWQKLKGGTQQLNADLLQNMLLNWSHLLQASAKNRAATATMDAAEKMAVAYKVAADTKGAVKVMRDGSAEHWMVEDPYLLDAISAIHYVPSPLMKPLAKFKQLLTWGVTVNPTFKIRNLIRDSVSAIAQSELGYNPGANVAKGWKLTAKDSQIYASMLASGGLIKFGTQENTDRLRAQVAKLGGVVLDKSGAERFFGQIKDLYDVYNEFGDRAENVNRAALYDALIKKGKTHAEAAFMARDLMDFSMGGSAPVVRFLTQAVPFLNARLVGLDKLGRAAMEDPRRFATVTGAVALASLALLAAYSDDDDWKKREDWDRDAYWWFKVGEQAYRIPKPFEVGAIGTLAERTAELMLSDEMTGKRYMERVSHMLSGTFSFNPVPQAFKPLLDLYANKDSFTGRAIESQADQRLRPQDRYSERTPEVAKFLGGLGLPDPAQLVKGEYSALSPKQVEHLIRGYFSWVGTAAMTVSDFGLRPLAGRGERPDMRLKDVFIAGNFVENLPTGSSRYVTQMYEQSRQVEQAYASYQEAIKAGDTEKAQSIKESAGPLLRNRPAYTAATRQLAEINRMAKRIEADQAMAGAAKRARLTQLEQQRHVIAQRVSRLAAATP